METQVVVHVHQLRIDVWGYLAVAIVCMAAVQIADSYFTSK